MNWWLTIGGIVVAAGYLNRMNVMADLDRQLTENFNLKEFLFTATGLDNIPGAMEINNIEALCQNVLQPLHYAVQRSYTGRKVVIKISSGFRSFLVNDAIGGAGSSQHMKGQAADFSVYVDGVRLANQTVIDLLRSEGIPYDQVIDEQLRGKQWIHVSFALDRQRMQWLTARDGVTGGIVYRTVQYG